MTRKKRLAIFASGSGTNAANIIRYFQGNHVVDVALVLSNRKKAGVLEKAKDFGVPAKTFDKATFYHSTDVLHWLKEWEIDFIVLAGFLMLVPEYLVNAYEGRIINIHPALLPKYGGKGMYGRAVHEAVLNNREKKTGITIHYVNHAYDRGKIIEQIEINIDPKQETVDTLEDKVHALEYNHYPPVIESVVNARRS